MEEDMIKKLSKKFNKKDNFMKNVIIILKKNSYKLEEVEEIISEFYRNFQL